MKKTFLIIAFAAFMATHAIVCDALAAGEPASTVQALKNLEAGTPLSKELTDNAGSYWQKLLITENDPAKRLDILNKLAAIKYEQALPQMGETLKADTRKNYWMPVLVFGKMGDDGIGYLIQRLPDKDRNVRINTIMVLGRWLLAQEAAVPFMQRYDKETDREIKILLIKGLEHCSLDMDAVAAFALKVHKTEKDKDIKKAAKETAESAKKVKKAVAEFKKMKKSDRRLFEAEYAKLYKSAGESGDVTALSKTSLITDEARLESLRERILLRNSLECLDDYDSISRIILFNRWASFKP